MQALADWFNYNTYDYEFMREDQQPKDWTHNDPNCQLAFDAAMLHLAWKEGIPGLFHYAARQIAYELTIDPDQDELDRNIASAARWYRVTNHDLINRLFAFKEEYPTICGLDMKQLEEFDGLMDELDDLRLEGKEEQDGRYELIRRYD